MLNQIKYIAPLNDSIIYCNKPRILFNLNNNKKCIVYITVKNDNGIFNYTSTRNPQNFSSIVFDKFSNITFIPDNIAIGENYITIRLYDNEDFNSDVSIVFIYKEPLIEINNKTTPITSSEYKKLWIMARDTLKAYGKDTSELDNIVLPVANYTKIYKSYFSRINNNLYDLNKWINDNYPGLNRIYTKEIIAYNNISKKIYNSILTMITCL